MESRVRVVIKIAVYLNERAGAEKSVPAFICILGKFLD
nr:MAG TPA: hypothetical protein [Caudoviricetes sp.]